MKPFQVVENKLSEGQVVVLDGGTGSELEKLGVTMDQDMWCGLAMETNPELVQKVHTLYMDAGADVITANTYSTPPLPLRRAGYAEKVEPWNRLAIELAFNARDQHSRREQTCIAGSVSTYDTWSDGSAEALFPSFKEQADLLVDCGVDLILLETLASPLDHVLAAVEATKHLEIPVWTAISCLEDRETGEIMFGVEESHDHKETAKSFADFGEAIDKLTNAGCQTLLVMHSEFSIAGKAVADLAEKFDGPVGIYPNAGYWERPKWVFVDQISPEVYADNAEAWVRNGANIVGGCCGVSPEQIKAVADRLAS